MRMKKRGGNKKKENSKSKIFSSSAEKKSKKNLCLKNIKRKASAKNITQKKVKHFKPIDNLTIHFMPYSEIVHEECIGRIKKILGIILQNKIVILQGRLRPEEEARLIENTMTLIGNIDGFQGIEIAALSNSDEDRSLFEKVRHNIARILVGEQDAVTIIGPASVIKEIKRNPRKIELMLKRR